MAIYNGWHRPTGYIGKSTEPKPTEIEWLDKLWFLEADTGDVYLFDGATWVFQYHIGGVVGEGLNKITVGTTPDPDPSVGDLWIDVS